ncbi:MAG: DUF4340 domain-containing protein [Acidobacteria bacterium]|nr:DUF4340 domain-containing protein [Acidobacteriota bacterium]
MKPRTTLVLLVLALALGAVVFFWERKLPGTSEIAERANHLLPDVAADDVTRLTLVRPAGRLVAERDGEGWRLSEPVRDRADVFAVKGLIEQVIEARVASRLPAAEIQGGDKATGLAEPQLKVVLATAAGESTVALGAEAPGGLRYARSGTGGEIALVDAALAEQLERPAAELRDHGLFDLSTTDVGKFTVEREGRREFAFERRDGESWWIVQPIQDAAADSEVTGALSRVLAIRAAEFLDQPPPAIDLGLDPPRFAVRLVRAGKDEPAGALLVGNPSGEGSARRYARAEGRDALVTIDAAEMLRDWDKEATAWRSTLALDFSAWDVTDVELERDGTTVRFAREGQGEPDDTWKLRAPDGFPFDAAQARDVVSNLGRVEARRLVDDLTPAAAGLERPAARFAVTLKVADQPPRRQELVIGGPAGEGEVYARRTGRTPLLVIDAETARMIDPARLQPARPPAGDTPKE